MNPLFTQSAVFLDDDHDDGEASNANIGLQDTVLGRATSDPVVVQSAGNLPSNEHGEAPGRSESYQATYMNVAQDYRMWSVQCGPPKISGWSTFGVLVE